MRRVGSLTALVLTAGGLLGGLLFLVVANARGISLALATGLSAAPYRLIATCISLFSLGPLQPLLILSWLVLLAVLSWLSTRLVWETSSRSLRTARLIRTLRHRQLRQMHPDLASMCSDLGLAGRIDLVACPAGLAFCYGLWKPRVLISTGLLQHLRMEEIEAVLLHERTHLLQRDPLRSLVAESLAAAFHPLQLVTALAQRVIAGQEVNADLTAVRAQGCSTHLAAALLRLLDAAAGAPPPAGLAISALSPTAVRVDALADPAAARALLAVPPRQLLLGLVTE